jgi:hypothetical protein
MVATVRVATDSVPALKGCAIMQAPTFDNRIMEVPLIMSEYFVMRRANGDLFAERIDNHLCIPVWADREEVERFKAHNPELMIFLPTRLTHSLVEKTNRTEEGARFFLLSSDAPDAPLDKGKEITPEELFSDAQSAVI